MGFLDCFDYKRRILLFWWRHWLLPHVLEQLEFIALGQRAGFQLEDIRQMLTGKGQYEINRDKLTEKAQEIAQHVKQLIAIQRCLEHAVS